MQNSLKRDLSNWERLGKRYNKDAMKIFRNIKNHFGKNPPNKEELNKFGE